MCIFNTKTLLWAKPNERLFASANFKKVLKRATRKAKSKKSVKFEFDRWPYLVVDSSLLMEAETVEFLKDFDKLFVFSVRKENRFFRDKTEDNQFILYDFTRVGMIV